MFTYEQAVRFRPKFEAAIETVLQNQSYTIAETTYTYANLSHLRQMLKECNVVIARRTDRGMKVKRYVARDD